MCVGVCMCVCVCGGGGVIFYTPNKKLILIELWQPCLLRPQRQNLFLRQTLVQDEGYQSNASPKSRLETSKSA